MQHLQAQTRACFDGFAKLIEANCITNQMRFPQKVCDKQLHHSIQPFTNAMDMTTSLRTYLERFRTREPKFNVFVVSLIYVGRFLDQIKCSLTLRNAPRLITTSFSLAYKYFDDEQCYVKRTAHNGGVSTKELAELEVVFLKVIQFNLNITQIEFDTYIDELEEYSKTNLSTLVDCIINC
jgi:hypothetical protein